jgi:hypothetical protein
MQFSSSALRDGALYPIKIEWLPYILSIHIDSHKVTLNRELPFHGVCDSSCHASLLRNDVLKVKEAGDTQFSRRH